MMTVRFPDGTSVQYNTATKLETGEDKLFYRLKDANDRFIARVPLTAIVENVPACRVYKGATDYRDQRLEAVERELRGLKRKISQALKAK